MERIANDQIEAKLARRFENNMDASLIANWLISCWQEIGDALRPVIGQRGVAALYQRSVYLTAPAYPWLMSSRDCTQSAIDIEHLKSPLLHQQPTDLISGGAQLFKTFHELLVGLIGPALTERLLRSVGDHLFCGLSAQDCS